MAFLTFPPLVSLHDADSSLLPGTLELCSLGRAKFQAASTFLGTGYGSTRPWGPHPC